MNPLSEWEAHLPVSVGVHVRELTQFEHHVYPEADRVTVTVAGTNNARRDAVSAARGAAAVSGCIVSDCRRAGRPASGV